MSGKSKKVYFLTNSILLLLQLAFLFFIKYFNQELSIDEFSLKHIGNLFNLFLYLGIILGIYLVLEKEKLNNSGRFIYSFTLISWLLLIIAFLSTRAKLISKSVYIFYQPGDKLFTGIILLIFLFVLVYFLISLWSRIIIRNKLSFTRNLFSAALLIILLLIFVYIFIGGKNYSFDKWKIVKSKNNVAVVLGAAVWSKNVPSPTLSLRVDKALDLLKNGIIDKIVLTGGSAPGEMTESDVAYEYAKVKGVDTTKVLIERTTSSTADQIKWIKNNLSGKDVEDVKIILVSDGYHLPRAIEISKFFNLKLQAAESNHKLDFKDKLITGIRESIALFIFWNFAL